MKCCQRGCDEDARPDSNYCSEEHCLAPKRGDKMVDATKNPRALPEKWQNGDQRLVRRISLLPRCVHGCWYWLSMMYVVQECQVRHDMTPDSGRSNGLTQGWKTKRWLVKKPQQFCRFLG